MKKSTILLSLFAVSAFISCNNGDEKTKVSDKVQIDSATKDKAINDSNAISFKKTLTLQGITYELAARGNGSERLLTIIPSGLKGSNDKITVNVEPITGAEIEDLDKDGFPELLVYTQSAGSGSYGNVVGYSPNKGKSLSQIYFPELEKGSAAIKGYMGHDEFAIVESSLVRRFKCYESNDVNAKPTGKIRQIQYKLKDGEASKKFFINKIVEIPVQ